MNIKKGMILINIIDKTEWTVMAFDGILVGLQDKNGAKIQRFIEEVKNDYTIKGS